MKNEIGVKLHISKCIIFSKLKNKYKNILVSIHEVCKVIITGSCKPYKYRPIQCINASIE